MSTKSTHTNHARKNHYGPGSSRGTRSATTLLAQVADIERGQRIKAQREELGFSQPEVVDEIERLARALPTTNRLHPDNPKAKGRAPVTLRGYQSWEAGGGIDPGKAKLLAEALQTDTRALVNGVPQDAPTPDPFAGQDGLADLMDLVRQDMVQRQQQRDEIIARLDRLEKALTQRVDDVARSFEQAAGAAGRGLRDDTPRPRAKAPKRAAKRTP